MNKDEREYLELQLKPIKNDIHDLKICLLGEIGNPESLGLVGIVKENTNFRKIASKALWLVFAGLITAWIKIIFF